MKIFLLKRPLIHSYRNKAQIKCQRREIIGSLYKSPDEPSVENFDFQLTFNEIFKFLLAFIARHPRISHFNDIKKAHKLLIINLINTKKEVLFLPIFYDTRECSSLQSLY